MRQLLTAAPDLDAVFAANDRMASAALDVLRDTGRRVPEDVAVGGFDDAPVAERTDPPLTTMYQPFRRISREMVRLLLAQIEVEELATVVVSTPGWWCAAQPESGRGQEPGRRNARKLGRPRPFQSNMVRLSFGLPSPGVQRLREPTPAPRRGNQARDRQDHQVPADGAELLTGTSAKGSLTVPAGAVRVVASTARP